MSEYIGKWWLVLWSSRNMIVEIGFGENGCTTNSVYQVRNYRFFSFYLSIVKPTLQYLIQEEDIKLRGWK